MSKSRTENNLVRTTHGLPSLPDINAEIFEKAGITADDRARLLSKVFAKTEKRLHATHVKVFHGPAGIVYSEPLIDHNTQGKAIEQAMQLVGLQKQEAPKLVVKASVVLPSWAVPNLGPSLSATPKDITPKDALDIARK